MKNFISIGTFIVVGVLSASTVIHLDSRSSFAQSIPGTAIRIIDSSGLRAASELFEKMTETAFTAPWKEVNKSSGKATNAAQKIRSSLSAEALVDLEIQIPALKMALQKQDRASFALASNEIFRILVSATTPGGKVPSEVSLLDYAGYRYDADLKAKSPRWEDMMKVVEFARETAHVLEPKLPSPELARQIDNSITALETAARDKNETAALKAVKSELDLVDDLEKAFLAAP